MAADLPPPPMPPGPVDVLARLRAAPALSLVVGAAVLLVVGVVAWRAYGPQAAPVEMTLPRATPASTEQPVVDDDGGGTAYVHVAGAVASPGVYRLGPSARVADALDAAGGPAGDADVDALNLAAKVADGERVYVPRKGESPPPPASGGAGPGGTAKPAVLDLNTATAEQLEELPGVGPATALAIVEHRTERGRFRSVDDLLEVRGIGEAKLAAIRPKVRVA